MAKNGVEYLYSQAISDAAKKVDGAIADYNEVIKSISGATTFLTSTWHGEGATAFEKDYSTIYQQLSDISDIMYDLYDALVDAAATYVKTDEEIAKGLSMDG